MSMLFLQESFRDTILARSAKNLARYILCARILQEIYCAKKNLQQYCTLVQDFAKILQDSSKNILLARILLNNAAIRVRFWHVNAFLARIFQGYNSCKIRKESCRIYIMCQNIARNLLRKKDIATILHSCARFCKNLARFCENLAKKCLSLQLGIIS